MVHNFNKEEIENIAPSRNKAKFSLFKTKFIL